MWGWGCGLCYPVDIIYSEIYVFGSYRACLIDAFGGFIVLMCWCREDTAGRGASSGGR